VQDPEEYELKTTHLTQLQALDKEGKIALYYGDESGFSLTSAIPYGWQFAGEQVATQPRHSQRFNVLGFYHPHANDLYTAARTGRLDSAFVIATLDAWVATRTTPTVLVLDNARLHHSAAFRARLQDWEDQDVHIFHLSTYSPHLNKIETLWRKVKYEWLRPEAYADFSALKTAVWHILDHVGQQYTIKFAP
jgi:transposase